MSAPSALTVATWNIRAAIGPGEPFPPAWWRHASASRLARIADLIRALGANVVALQEVAVFDVDGILVDQPAELARLTGFEVRYAAAHHAAATEPESARVAGTLLWGNAILSRLPILDSWASALPAAADDDLVEPAGARHPLDGSPDPLAGVPYRHAPAGVREPRCALRATVESALGPVDVLSTHLTYAGEGQRHAQAACLAELAAGTGRPVVLAGDLNATIDSPSLAPLQDAFADAFAASGMPADDLRRQTCGSWPIDHILVRGLDVASCRVARETDDASDHWPVVARLVPRHT